MKFITACYLEVVTKMVVVYDTLGPTLPFLVMCLLKMVVMWLDSSSAENLSWNVTDWF